VNFLFIATKLKNDISDYRDYEIAHEKSPRRLSGTAFDEQGRMRMIRYNLYPTERDKQVESKALHELANHLTRYITSVSELVESNRHKTKLRVLAAEGPPGQSGV